jgi:hypothetical protein
MVARDIKVTNNLFFDSQPPGRGDCVTSLDLCAARQRQYILVQRVDGVRVAGNTLQDGGRIKLGSSGIGRNMTITDNTLDFINDNGITIVEGSGASPCLNTSWPCTALCPYPPGGEGLPPCLSENVTIARNVICNPINVGIFFGSDGEGGASSESTLRNIRITANRINDPRDCGPVGFLHLGIQGGLEANTDNVVITDTILKGSSSVTEPLPVSTYIRA